jgi:carboxypeptidase C (cathepsin A)
MTDDAEQAAPAQDPAAAGRPAESADPAAAAAEPAAAEPKDDLVTTRHAMTVDGAELRYTVTAGRVVLRQEGHTDDTFDGVQAKAEVFMVAYTLDDAGADPGSRPVAFAFNGGPGSASVWLHLGLRPEHIRFLTELLRDERRTAGRLDGRFTGWDADYGREHWTTDPSIDAVMGPYTAALNHYVRTELRYENDLPYETLTERVHPWSFKEFEGVNVQVVDKLAEAMRVNPHMRVLVACGYHDAATPYFAAEHDVAHLAIPAELAANIEFAYSEAGHMMYLHEASRLAQSEQLARFVSGRDATA